MVNYLCYNEGMRDKLVEALRQAREIVDEAWGVGSSSVAKDYCLPYLLSYLLRESDGDKSERTAFGLLGMWLDHNKTELSREEFWEAYRYFLEKVENECE